MLAGETPIGCQTLGRSTVSKGGRKHLSAHRSADGARNHSGSAYVPGADTVALTSSISMRPPPSSCRFPPGASGQCLE
jgi:ribosomal protein L35